MLVKRYYMKDIRIYEEEHNISILDLFKTPKLCNLAELITLGNQGIDIENAYEMLDMYFNEEGDMLSAYEEIRDCLLGKQTSDEDGIDSNKYKTMTDIYSDLCSNLMSVGIAYGEFWNMTTKEMYKVFDSIQIKVKNDLNRALQIAHISAGMTGAATWGKLQKNAPHIDITEDEDEDEDEIVNLRGYGEIDRGTANTILALKARHKKGVNK